MYIEIATLSFSFLFSGDRLEGIWIRLKFFEVHPVLFFLSHITYNLLITLIIIIESSIFIFNFSEIDVQGSFVDIFAILLMVGMMGLMFGLLNSIINDSIIFSFYFLTTFVLGCLMIGGKVKQLHKVRIISKNIYSGILWPIEAQPILMQKLQYFLPVSMPGIAMRAVLFKGAQLTDRTVLNGILVCMSWTFGVCVISLIISKKRMWLAMK